MGFVTTIDWTDDGAIAFENYVTGRTTIPPNPPFGDDEYMTFKPQLEKTIKGWSYVTMVNSEPLNPTYAGGIVTYKYKTAQRSRFVNWAVIPSNWAPFIGVDLAINDIWT